MMTASSVYSSLKALSGIPASISDRLYQAYTSIWGTGTYSTFEFAVSRPTGLPSGVTNAEELTVTNPGHETVAIVWGQNTAHPLGGTTNEDLLDNQISGLGGTSVQQAQETNMNHLVDAVFGDAIPTSFCGLSGNAVVYNGYGVSQFAAILCEPAS